MRATVVECIVGVFALDNDNRIVDTVFFHREKEEMVEAVRRIQRGEIVGEVVEIIKGLVRKGYRELLFENANLAVSVRKAFEVEVFIKNPSRGGKYLRSNLSRLTLEKGSVKNLEEYYRIIHEVTTLLAKKAVQEASSRRDLLISQTIFVIDDLDKTFNLFANRLREWYGYHFPELSRLVDKNEKYLKLIASLGRRDRFTVEKLTKESLTQAKSEAIQVVARSSIGAEIRKDDISKIQDFARALLKMYDSRNSLEIYLDGAMKEVAPNICKLVGPTLGARLIAKVGGLANLAKKSSSTIQVLGAEKALFRSLRTGTRPPKHGLIFQHREIHSSPRRQRGKIARALASKLAIAARLDAYGGKYMGEKLKEVFEERVEEIREKYVNNNLHS